MPQLRVSIAKRGALCSDGTTSAFGHMWFTLIGDGGGEICFGFGPKKPSSAFGPGKVSQNDDSYYKDVSYTRTIDITSSQYNKILAFGKAPTSFKFNLKYNGITNSCIDFVWAALRAGGLNPKGFEGSLLPNTQENRLRLARIIGTVENAKEPNSSTIFGESPRYNRVLQSTGYFGIPDYITDLTGYLLWQESLRTEVEQQGAPTAIVDNAIANMNDFIYAKLSYSNKIKGWTTPLNTIEEFKLGALQKGLAIRKTGFIGGSPYSKILRNVSDATLDWFADPFRIVVAPRTPEENAISHTTSSGALKIPTHVQVLSNGNVLKDWSKNIVDAFTFKVNDPSGRANKVSISIKITPRKLFGSTMTWRNNANTGVLEIIPAPTRELRQLYTSPTEINPDPDLDQSSFWSPLALTGFKFHSVIRDTDARIERARELMKPDAPVGIQQYSPLGNSSSGGNSFGSIQPGVNDLIGGDGNALAYWISATPKYTQDVVKYFSQHDKITGIKSPTTPKIGSTTKQYYGRLQKPNGDRWGPDSKFIWAQKGYQRSTLHIEKIGLLTSASTDFVFEGLKNGTYGLKLDTNLGIYYDYEMRFIQHS